MAHNIKAKWLKYDYALYARLRNLCASESSDYMALYKLFHLLTYLKVQFLVRACRLYGSLYHGVMWEVSSRCGPANARLRLPNLR